MAEISETDISETAVEEEEAKMLCGEGAFDGGKMLRALRSALTEAQASIATLEAETIALRAKLRGHTFTVDPEVEEAHARARKAEAERDALNEENFALAAGQCLFLDGSGLYGDEHGHQRCTMQEERDALAGQAAALREALDYTLRAFDWVNSENMYPAVDVHLISDDGSHIGSLSDCRDALASTADLAARHDRDMQVAGMLEAAEIAGLHAWKHVGEDAYSRGMDAGAIHQCKVIVDGIRAAAKLKEEG